MEKDEISRNNIYYLTKAVFALPFVEWISLLIDYAKVVLLLFK